MKNRIGKIVIAAIFAIGMVIPMFSNVMAVNAADSDYQMVSYTAADAKSYLDSDKSTYPADKDGYLFAGWYRNEDHGDIQNAIVSSNDVPESGAYALYVPKEVLGLKAQLSGNLTDTKSDNDENGAIRFVTSVDSLNYKDAGFFFTFEGGKSEVKRSNNKVSAKLFGIYESGVNKEEVLTEYTPSATFHVLSKYFKTHAFVNIPKNQFDLKITAVPFWETLDGTIVRGDSVVKTINQGKWVHVKADGSDETGDGSIGKPYATLGYALDKVTDGGTICIDGTYAVPENYTWTNHSGKSINIRGDKLDFTALSAVNINDNVTFDDITLGFKNGETVYANGYEVTVGEKTVFADGAYINIYGGGNNTDVASTKLTLLAGDYKKINGAGNGGTVTGDANLYVAGTVNATRDFSKSDACIINGGSSNGNSIVGGNAKIYIGGNANGNVNFSSSHHSSMNVYGAGEYGTVKGDTEVTVEGNAKVLRLYGGGFSTTVEGSTHVTVSGDVNSGLLYDTAYSDSLRGAHLYGGGYVDTVNKNTYVDVKENASFSAIFGGARGATGAAYATLGVVKGETNVTVSDNVNANAGTAVSKHTHVGIVCGGGSVFGSTGNTNVRISGTPTLTYIYGAGYSTGAKVKDTSVTLNTSENANILSVYGGGSQGIAENTSVEMLSGTVPQIFGGCEYAGMTGNTDLRILGGKVTRRFAGGCYNGSGTASQFVTGYTAVTLGKDAQILCTDSSLTNDGRYVGSLNIENNNAEEHAILFVPDYDNNTNRNSVTANTYQYLVKLPATVDASILGSALQVVPSEEVQIQSVKVENGNDLVKNADGTYQLPEYSDSVINIVISAQLWDGNYIVHNYEELQGALQDIENRDTTKEAVITVAGDFEIPETVTINTGRNITLLNDAEVQTVKIYRGLGLANADMFRVAKGATLTIRGTGNNNSFVLDGRTEAEAKAETAKDGAVGSSGSLISNYGNLTIDNITVQHVKKKAGTGGVINHNADNQTNADAMVTIRNSVFDNNSSASYGSVLYSRAKAVITGSTFTYNSANANGGVLCNHNGTLFTVDSCEFSHNAGKAGGAVWTNTTSLITGSTFEANAGTNGGAIYNNGANLTLTNTVFEKNTADNQGGAVGNHGKSATLTDCKFSGNIAKMSGGGFYSGSNSEVIIQSGEHSEQAVFEHNRGNTAGTEFGGGAICIGSGKLTVENYTFKGNTTEVTTDNDGQGGGAIRMNAASSVLQVNGCTFDSNNSKSCGGAISNKATMTIKNSTFGKNSAKKGGAVYNQTGTMTLTGINTVSAIFKDNTATENGGAIYLAAGTLNGSGYEFTGNTPNHIYVAGGTNNYKEYAVSSYEELQAAVTDVANLKTENAVYIKVTESFDFTGTITIPANCNIAIEDDGSGDAKTLTKTKTANMFVMSKGATLTFRSSGTVDEPKLILDGNNISHTEYATMISANGITQCNINILQGVEFKNNIQTGNGSVIRIKDSDSSKLYIDGGRFENNVATDRAGGVMTLNNASAIIKNAVFTGNTADYGGAIETNGKLDITNCRFENNRSVKEKEKGGGAIYAWSSSVVTITDSEFIRNSAVYDGGAIYNLGKLTLAGTGNKALFQGNTASNWGGAVYTSGGTFNVDGYTFADNSATHGGAILMFTESTVKNSTFTGNRATVDAGGAVYVTTETTFENCRFDSNTAINHGGAIYKSGNVKLTLTGTGENALLMNNQAGVKGAAKYGGAISANGGTFVVEGYTFEGNSAAAGGALLMNTVSTIKNSTFKGNHTNVTGGFEGGAMYIQNTATLENCKFDGNSAATNGGAILMNAGSKTLTLIGTDKTKAMFINNSANNGSGSGGAIRLHAGTLTGSGYEFTNNSPDNISRRNNTSAVNNYKE